MNVALPTSRPIRRDWARDIALELLDKVRGTTKRYAIIIDPDGLVHILRWSRAGREWRDWSLAGVYDASADLTSIVDDILAMQREPMHEVA